MKLPFGYTKTRSNLENGKRHIFGVVEGATMSRNNKKIRRRVEINGRATWITADTEQEYADKLLATAGKTSPIRQTGHPFQAYATTWFNTFSKPNVSEVTAITYERQLKKHIYPVLGKLDLEEIKPSDIQKIYNRMGSDVTSQTKNKVKIVLNQIFKMAVEDEIILRNPVQSSTLRMNGLPSKETKPYSIEQMRYLVGSLYSIADPTDRAWLALSTLLPLRPEEVLGLQWIDIDERSCTIHVHNTVTHPTRSEPHFKPSTKTAASTRVLAFPNKMLGYLPERGKDEEFVIGGPSPHHLHKASQYAQTDRKGDGFRRTHNSKAIPNNSRN